MINQYYTPGMSRGGSPSYERDKREFDKRMGRIDASGRDDQGADLNMDAIRRLSRDPENRKARDAAAEEARRALAAESLPIVQIVNPGLSDDANARDSAYQAMKQQYAPQADIWATDEGKAILAAAQTNQYGGEAAGLADYYSNQQKAGIGAMPEIVDALGYEEGSAMAQWAQANPALAMREYNKKFANSYEGTGPDSAAIQQAMDQGKYFPSEGSPNPLGETGVATDMNMAQFAETQPVAMQASGNTPFFTESIGISGLGGKDLYNKYAIMLGKK